MDKEIGSICEQQRAGKCMIMKMKYRQKYFKWLNVCITQCKKKPIIYDAIYSNSVNGQHKKNKLWSVKTSIRKKINTWGMLKLIIC